MLQSSKIPKNSDPSMSNQSVSNTLAPTLQVNGTSQELEGPMFSHDKLGDEKSQSYDTWLADSYRVPLTQDQKTLYILRPPQISEEMARKLFQVDCVLRLPCDTDNGSHRPKVADITAYVQTFYDGLPVKVLPGQLHYTGVTHFANDLQTQYKLELSFEEEDGTVTVLGEVQGHVLWFGNYEQICLLNSLDLGALAKELLPADACSILLLVNERIVRDMDSIHEGTLFGMCEDDLASLTVSIDTHNPFFIHEHGRIHDADKRWPTCYTFDDTTSLGCETYVSPMKAATDALAESMACNLWNSSINIEKGYWLYRVNMTVAHETGHVFRIRHCRLYACCMNVGYSPHRGHGDEKPPFFCPNCLEKLIFSTRLEINVDKNGGVPNWITKEVCIIERYGRLLQYCDMRADTPSFAGHGAWIKAVLRMCGSQKYVKAVLARIGIEYSSEGDSRVPRVLMASKSGGRAIYAFD